MKARLNCLRSLTWFFIWNSLLQMFEGRNLLDEYARAVQDKREKSERPDA